MRIIIIYLILFHISTTLSYCSFDIKKINVECDIINTFICDFNNDQNKDIITLKSPFSIILYKGNGDLSFDKYAEYTVDFTNFLICDDFNNDGYNDLLFRNGIMLGGVDGVFGEQKSVNVYGGNAISADFNKDGFRDVLTISTFGDEMLLFINNGNISFSVPISIKIGRIKGIIPLSTCDFNDDGFMDLLIGYSLLTDEYGNYVPEYTYCTGILFGPINDAITSNFYSLSKNGKKGKVCDLNNDHYPDIILMDNIFETYLNNGKGIFNLAWSYESSDYRWQESNHPVLIDEDKDGKSDILSFGNNTPEGNFSNKYSIMTGKEDGTFNKEEFFNYDGNDVINTIVSDINNDNNDEILLLCTDGVYMLIYGIITNIISENEHIIMNKSYVTVFPNPANLFTTITYSITLPSKVRLDIFSVTGQKVLSLVDGHVSSGVHAVKFDGSQYGSGLYFYRFSSDKFTKTGKMLLLK
ncbi:MAG: FG-GAP-like repeat-containing protein [Candidatus Latescibacter sp.]|nr:FG-GAP-like repeat-containing protein [Candidatus Latescibacter sp.]